MNPMDYLKLLAAMSPLITAIGAVAGIQATAAHVDAWIQLITLLGGFLGSAFPSVRAWLNHREKAE